METKLTNNLLRIHTVADQNQNDSKGTVCWMQAFSESRKRCTRTQISAVTLKTPTRWGQWALWGFCANNPHV